MVCCALGCAPAGGGCGNSSERDAAATGRGSADAAAPLPRGWQRIGDAQAGFTLGLPPGWTSQVGSATTIARPEAGGVALSVSADGSKDGRKDTPEKYLRVAIEHLNGYRALRVGQPRPLKGLAYPAAMVTASGVFAQTGVPQEIQLYALRRPERVTFIISVFRSTDIAGSRYMGLVDRIVRSLRARPPPS